MPSSYLLTNSTTPIIVCDPYFYNSTTTSYNITITETTFTQTTFNPYYQASGQIDVVTKTTKQLELAKRKARRLLKDHLSVPQWKDFLKFGYFEVIATSGAIYRIKNGRSRNVIRIEDGVDVEILCAHPGEQCPNEDTMLAQKFMLETDETLFRKTANIEKLYVNKKEKIVPQSAVEFLNNVYVQAA